jgi:hypothetical protein
MISVFNVLFLLYVKKVAGDTDGVKNIIVCELTHPLPPPPSAAQRGGGRREKDFLHPLSERERVDERSDVGVSKLTDRHVRELIHHLPFNSLPLALANG